MRTTFFALLFSLAFALPSLAQDTTGANATATDPTTTILIARTGLRTDAPYIGTYHCFEVFQLRGKWIYPDVGYIDFATNNYREIFVGAGRTLYDGERLMVAEELYYTQAVGPAAKSAKYLQPYTLIKIHFTRKFSNETVYFPYLPLNNPARVQHVLERSKLEYALNEAWKVGAGYAGYKYGDDQWQNKPIITTTVSTKRGGAFEFWLQEMPGGGQIQVRYTLVHVGKK